MGYVLSLGGIPAQAGQSEGEATGALEDVGLAVNVEREHNREIDEGEVMEVQIPEGTVREGDTITLVVSQGPPMVTVPDVTDMTLRAAKEELEDLGFDVEVDTSISIEALWRAIDVVSQDPEGGTEVPEGSTVTIEGEY